MAKTKSRTSSKKKSKARKSSILLTILVVIAFGSFLIYKKMVTPIGINEVSASPISCSQGLSDNFDGPNIDTTKWMVEINQDGEAAKINDGKIELTSPTSNAVIRVLGVPMIKGNFSAEIDMSTPIASGNDPSQYAQFVFREPNSQGNYAGITRNSDGQIMSYVFGGYYGDKGINQYSKYANIPKDVIVRAKIIRDGTHLKIYYKTTGDYILLADYPDIATTETDMIPRMNLGPIDGTPITATTTKFDNFSISCIAPNKPPAPTNPRSTCNPDGKSIRLIWDTVSDAQSYKVRVDDKAGKVTPYDGISKGEYVATINPNQTYTWWAHATKDGIDSAETPRLDFKCVPTSTPTPTPKPTVKPTVKPTATPSITPTPTPTTQTYIVASPKPSAFAYENIATEPETETTTKSTNPLARFFTWLASLFE